MSQSQARRAYGDVHLYYRADAGSKCWYAKKRQDRAVASVPASRFDWSMFIPRPNAPIEVEEDEAPRPRAKVAKVKRHHTAKPRTRVAAREVKPVSFARPSVAPSDEAEFRRILCGTDCPDFNKMGDLRALNERRAREADVRKAFGFAW